MVSVFTLFVVYFFFLYGASFLFSCISSILSLNHGALSLCDIINVLLSIVFFVCWWCSIWVPPWNRYCWRIYSFACMCVCLCVCALDTHVNTNRRMSIKIVPCLLYCKSDQRSINIMCPALISTYSTATATTTTKVRSFLPFFLFRLSNSNSSAPQHISISMNFFWSKFGGIHSKYW